MALTTTTNKVIHDGNASATVFPYTFPILSASHLTVIYTDEDDVETTLSASQFSVTGIGGRTGGSVTYPLTGSPIATGTKLTIVRTVPYTQTTVLSNQGGYYPEVVEARLDQIYMAMQQLAEIVGRTSTFSISDAATEQSNYALIQALQADIGDFDKLTTAGDILSHNGTAYIRTPRGDADQYLSVTGSALAWKDLIIDLATSQVTGVLPAANGGFVAPKGYASQTIGSLSVSGSYSSTMQITEGTQMFSTSYAPSVAGRTLVIEVDVAGCAGQNAAQLIGIFVNNAADAVAQALLQFPNVASAGYPNRAVYVLTTASTTAIPIECRIAGGGTCGIRSMVIREFAP
tara:strand:- start:41246 stop:42283 length:1038 start_codon:yes stop_codon:yes gene_type:complete